MQVFRIRKRFYCYHCLKWRNCPPNKDGSYNCPYCKKPILVDGQPVRNPWIRKEAEG